MVTAEGHAALFVPVVYLLEIAVLRKPDYHIVVIEPYLLRLVADVLEYRFELRYDIITLDPLEIFGKLVVPEIAADIEIQLVREEEIESLSALSRKMLVEFSVEFFDNIISELRIHRVDRIGQVADDDLAVDKLQHFSGDFRVLF